MAKLSYRRRKRMSRSQFACPRLRAYPIHDRKRVINARIRTKTFGVKCKGQVSKICNAASRFGLLSPEYPRRKGWIRFCRRR